METNKITLSRITKSLQKKSQGRGHGANAGLIGAYWRLFRVQTKLGRLFVNPVYRSHNLATQQNKMNTTNNLLEFTFLITHDSVETVRTRRLASSTGRAHSEFDCNLTSAQNGVKNYQ